MAFLNQISSREDPANFPAVAEPDLASLAASGLIARTTKDEYDNDAAAVQKLSQLTLQLSEEKTEEQQQEGVLGQDQREERSIRARFEAKEKREALAQKVQAEATAVDKERSELAAMEARVNELIQTKSMVDRMVPYGGEYLSLTDMGVVVLHDLIVRNYRVAGEEFSDFLAEIKATYGELRSIADKSAFYTKMILPKVPEMEMEVQAVLTTGVQSQTTGGVLAPSLIWTVAIGLAKLQGDPNQLGERFLESLEVLRRFKSTTANKLMAAEVMTAIAGQDVNGLESALKDLDKQVRGKGVPDQVSAGVAATIMAGRRFDGTYPMDRFVQFQKLTKSSEAAALLAAINVNSDELGGKFQIFRDKFNAWGYMMSEDTEIASAFLALGELDAPEVEGKLQYIIEQLRNYLEYPLVAAAILASIAVFEAHEALDLMEKAVTLLSAYTRGLERSELVTLAVLMVHGVRNELVKQMDSTAKIAATPVQFSYTPHPGFFFFFPVVVAHSTYHATFSAMGGYHPAHSHGVGGFAG
jgi:hypothetical protein